MTDNIVTLHGRPREVAQVARIGIFEHYQCEHLLSADARDQGHASCWSRP